MSNAGMLLMLNVARADLADKYKSALKKNYSDPTSTVVSEVFSVLSGKTLVKEAASFARYLSDGPLLMLVQLPRRQRGQVLVQSQRRKSLRAGDDVPFRAQASDGDPSLRDCKRFLLEVRAHTICANCRRTGTGSVLKSRTFDLKFNLKGGTSHQFSSFNK